MTSIPRPLNARGATKKRWQQAEDAGHAAVLSRVRARRGLCEAPSCDLPAEEDAHLFSRGRVSMSAPWCHAPELRRGLCRGHHRACDGNVLTELRDEMRWDALMAAHEPTTKRAAVEPREQKSAPPATQEAKIVAGRVIQARAQRRGQKARIALDGPTGSGKTWSALIVARELDTDDKGILLIDTERGSASLYGDEFEFATVDWTPPYDPTELASLLRAESANYGVIVIDSLSHFWTGEGGTLDVVDRNKQKFQGSSFNAWSVGSKAQEHMVESILLSACHVIVTMRSKMEYVQEKDKDGKTRITKVGLAPIQREGFEYEMTIVGDLDLAHRLTINKSRCKPIADKVFQPGRTHELGAALRDWLSTASTEPVPVPDVTISEARANVVAALRTMPQGDARTVLRASGWPDTKPAVGEWIATLTLVQLDGLCQALAIPAHIVPDPVHETPADEEGNVLTLATAYDGDVSPDDVPF